MLESIYGSGMRGGPTDALGRYLQGAGQKKKTAAAPGAAPTTQFGQGGSPVDIASLLGKGTGPGGSYMVPGMSANPDGSVMNAGDVKAFQQSQTGGAGPDLAHLNFDYSSDPVLMKMQAGGARDTADAEQQAVDAKRSLALQYGDKGFASSILDPTDPTLGAVSDNPDTSTSTLARLKRAYAGTVKDNEDSMNENNLFYSGYRGRRLGDLAKDEQTQESDASSAAQAALGQIGSALAGSKRQIADTLAGGESDAANRKIQQVLAEIGAGGTAAGGANGGLAANGAPADTGAPAPDTGASADTGPVDTTTNTAAGAVGDLVFDPASGQWVTRGSRASIPATNVAA